MIFTFSRCALFEVIGFPVLEAFTFDSESHCVHVIFFLCHRYDLYLYSLLLALKKEGRLYRLRRWSKPSDEGGIISWNTQIVSAICGRLLR